MTLKDETLLHVLGSMALGVDAYTDANSRMAQTEFSDTLPVRVNRGYGEDKAQAIAALERWGFKLGEPANEKALFRPVQLPAGWQREGTSQPLWSRILDDEGRVRLSIFTGPFYEREAFFNIEPRYGFDTKELDEATRFYRILVVDRKLCGTVKSFLGVYGEVHDEARSWFKEHFSDADNPAHWDQP
jgi:hypothetical protein